MFFGVGILRYYINKHKKKRRKKRKSCDNMGYVGSYIWKIRQKVGHDEIVSASTDTVPIRDGKVCMVFNKDYQAWCFPGGHVELGRTWEEAARAELFEEAGLTAKDEDMKAFAAISGYRLVYDSGDATSLFSLTFVCEKFEEQDFPDTEEIAEKRWFEFDEIDGLKKSDYANAIWDAYKKYLETGAFQQVVLRNL